MSDDDDDAPRGKKRVLKEIRINRISAVDAPAQEGALATILKRVATCEEIPADLAARMTPTQRAEAETSLAAGKEVVVEGADGTTLATVKRQPPAAPAPVPSQHTLQAKDDAQQKFERAVLLLAHERKVPKHIAEMILRREQPELFQQYIDSGNRTATKRQPPAAPAPVKSQHETLEPAMSRNRWDEAVDLIASSRKIPRHRAMSIARKEQPKLWAAYEEESNRSTKKALEDATKRIAKSDAVETFDKMVLAVMARDGSDRFQAYQTAARLFPELRQRYADAQA